MPLRECQADGLPGVKWGEAGACYTYQPGDEDGRDELYDLAADPSEKNNLASVLAAESARLTAAVIAWHHSLPLDHGATYRPPAKKGNK